MFISGNSFLKYFLVFVSAACFWLFAAALPPFYIGLWLDSESVLLCAHTFFVLISIGLSGYLLSSHKVFISGLSQIFVATAIFSSLATIWAENKILHHIGSPLLGEGTVLFTGLSVLSLLYDNINLKSYKFFRYSAILAALTVLTLIIVNHPKNGLGWHADWVPYMFTSFLVPIAIGLFTLCVRAEIYEKFIVVALCIFLMVFSFNKVMWVFLPLIAIAWCFLKSESVLYEVLCCVLIPLTVVFANIILPLGSLKFSMQVYYQTWCDNLFSLFYGHGWASYLEHLTKNLMQIPVGLFENGVWSAAGHKIDFHSMHQGMESLFGLGILGLVFYLLLVMHPVAAAARNRVCAFFFASAYAAFSSISFTLMCVWPFLMLGFSEFTVKRQILNKRKYLMLMWLGLCTAFSSHAAYTIFNTAVLYPSDARSIFAKFACTDDLPDQERLKQPYNYRGLHLSNYLFVFLQNQNLLNQHMIETETNNIQDVYDYNDSPLNLDIAMLNLLKYQADLKKEEQILYEDIVGAVLRKAPKRTDLVEPYLNYLLMKSRCRDASVLIENILKRNPYDPCGLWYKGIYLAHEKQTDAGFKLLKQAMDLKVEQFIKIPQDLKQRIKSYA